MTSFQDIKRASRKRLHEHLARDAMLYSTSGGTPLAVTVRHHDEMKRVGDLAGTNLSYAEQAERPAQLVFLNEQLVLASLQRGSMVVLTATEGYFVDVVHPPAGVTTNCDVTPLAASELSGRQLPDGSVIP